MPTNIDYRYYNQTIRLFNYIKGGLTSQDNDGINNLKDYLIISTILNDRVKTIKVKFKI